ncbi:hypothetical protein [Persephonella sp.]
MKRTFSNNFFLEFARGTISKHKAVNVFGHNLTVGTTSETIWEGGGLYSYLTTASTLKISSSDINDTVNGTGARTLLIEGLDGDYKEISEAVNLNGQTPVNTSNSYLRIHKMTVKSAGSNGSNIGTVYAGTGTVTSGVPANVYAQIGIGENKTLICIYTIPAGKTGYVCSMLASSDSQKTTEVNIVIRNFGEVFREEAEYHFYQDTINGLSNMYIEVPEKSDIEVRAKVGATTAEIASEFCVILVDNQ